ncbi:MAG: TusE/DsrC/DsvC family sulfur relay protein [Candidatus Latescibacteria bacterium]|nr:TusE/DsrC/DsvC family sulfur relay protein [Candidatus Latescibacterota bacterium]
METRVISGKTIEIDTDGNLADHTVWDENIALELAKELGIDELTDGHKKVIHYLRDEYKSSGEIPTMRKIGKKSGVDMKELYKLFPDGPLKKAAKISGLPKPKSCV